MSKFIHNDEREGSCYPELQLCGNDKPLKNAAKAECKLLPLAS